MADFEMQDLKALINIGQVGTGTLEGRITDLRVQEFVLNEVTGKMEFMDNTVIRTDAKWQIVLEWELAGTALDPGILALKGAWVARAYLEGWGKNADEVDLDGDTGNIKLMDHKPDKDINGNVLPEKSRTGSDETAWLYKETITINPTPVPPKTPLNVGPYKLAITVTYVDDNSDPGPMAGFYELPQMIQIYQPKKA
jgi:hypothetical protein